MSPVAPGVFSSDDGQLLLISAARCRAAPVQDAAACAAWASVTATMHATAARVATVNNGMKSFRFGETS